MITLVRSGDRRYVRRRQHEGWSTFFNPVSAEGFGGLTHLGESVLPPNARTVTAPRHDTEMITYVLEGALAFADNVGRSGVLRAGEFQRATSGPRVRHNQVNASRTDSVRFLQLKFQPASMQFEPALEQKRFFAADRKGRLCIVASPDGRSGSLRLRQDVLVYSAILAPGEHVAHELAPGRRAWLHMVRGKAKFLDDVLSTGDGVGVFAERTIALTAEEDAEILLIDMEDQVASAPENGTTHN